MLPLMSLPTSLGGDHTMNKIISAEVLDRALANLSDVPVVRTAYTGGYEHRQGSLAILFGRLGDGGQHDWPRVLLALIRMGEDDLVEELVDTFSIDSPSYSQEWYVLGDFTLDGVSKYQDEDGND
jgi:hypothetical protein